MDAPPPDNFSRSNTGCAAAPVVMKFGGSSVADLDKLRQVAEVVAARAARQSVVVVVSAMGKATNELVAQARELCDAPPAREMDMLLTTGERHSMAMLALALHQRGRAAISLTGSQCGLITDHQHGRARVVEVRAFRILDELAAGNVVIVGGFQGVSYKREVTTLGRGGSDSSAVALAAALGADCEIYSDVDGIYSADPRIVPDARRLDELGYDEMQALSRAGAKVLHAQAVELARERGIAIFARATRDPGGAQTVIRADAPQSHGVRAVTCDAAVASVRVNLGNDAPRAIVHDLATRCASFGLRHFQLDAHQLSGVLSLAQRDDADAVETALGRAVAQACNDHDVALDCIEWKAGLAEISCIGSALDEREQVMRELLESLGTHGLEIHAAYVRPNSIGVLVDAEHADVATRALHAHFIG